MRRREFIAGLGSTAAWPLAARAQRPTLPVIGLLNVISDRNGIGTTAIRKGLSEAGFIEGQNLTIEYRGADNRSERLPALADDLVRRRVAAIGALGGPSSAFAAMKATAAIPIVFAAPDYPVELGLVASLNRPGGNLTGVAGLTSELSGKRLAMLHELAPGAATVGVLGNPASDVPISINVSRKAVSEAAQTLGLKTHFVTANSEVELEPAFASLARERVDALLVDTSAPLLTWRSQIAALAVRYKIAALYARREFAEAGGLISYGADLFDMYRQAGVYLGRVLKGEKPADLPVLRPTKFELVINLNTAKTQGMSLPETLLALADKVIE